MLSVWRCVITCIAPRKQRNNRTFNGLEVENSETWDLEVARAGVHFESLFQHFQPNETETKNRMKVKLNKSMVSYLKGSIALPGARDDTVDPELAQDFAEVFADGAGPSSHTQNVYLSHLKPFCFIDLPPLHSMP